MKIPASIKVGPYDYIVQRVLPLDAMGETFLDSLVIKIKADLPTQSLEETFLHELIHAVNYVYCSKALKEGEIRQLSIGLYQVLKDNGFLKEK